MPAQRHAWAIDKAEAKLQPYSREQIPPFEEFPCLPKESLDLVMPKGTMTRTEASVMIEMLMRSSAVVNLIDIDKNLMEEANSPASNFPDPTPIGFGHSAPGPHSKRTTFAVPTVDRI